ncbi:Galectin-9 [Labeo rohita]|uniref:Galectin-9 n=1 Tax=Labeo rohita TaxID=84645 RepID=A0ABQ8LBV9_LABRO|nr:Galectin-9 [Labeo rohita]
MPHFLNPERCGARHVWFDQAERVQVGASGEKDKHLCCISYGIDKGMRLAVVWGELLYVRAVELFAEVTVLGRGLDVFPRPRLVGTGTSLPARLQYKRMLVEHNILFFVFKGLFCLKRLHPGKSYLLSSIMSTHAVSYEAYSYEDVSLSFVPLFEEGGAAICGSGPAAAEARRKLKSWGSQVDLADELRKGLSRSFVTDESKLMDDDAISLTSSDPAASALLGFIQEEQEMLEEGKEVETEPSQSSCHVYAQLLEVMERATASLDLPWKRAKKVAFARSPHPSAQESLPYLPNLHVEVEKVWKNLFSSHICSLLPSKPLQDTSRLNGRAYAAAGQAVASLHTMTVFKAYQADLLKDLDKGKGLSPDEDCAAPQILPSIYGGHGGYGEASLGEPDGYREKREGLSSRFPPVLPSELFGTSIKTVVENFKEVKVRSAAFKSFIPRRPRSEPEQQRGPSPSWSEDRRQAQKASVATHAPPPPPGGAGRRSQRSRPDQSKT